MPFFALVARGEALAVEELDAIGLGFVSRNVEEDFGGQSMHQDVERVLEGVTYHR